MSLPEIKLVFDEPTQRKKAPKHLADYSPEERRELAKSLGLPAFRANQVATHYFSHLSNDVSIGFYLAQILDQIFTKANYNMIIYNYL